MEPSKGDSSACSVRAGSEVKATEQCDKRMKLGTKQFVFLEMFSSMSGLSAVIAAIAGQHNVQVMEPLDQHGDWNIFEELGMERALAVADVADHVHIALPCHSFSKTAGSDQLGGVTQVRSDLYPEGWGHQISEEGNKILECVFAVCLRLLERKATFAVENPADSYAWETRWLKKLAKKEGMKWVMASRSGRTRECAKGLFL